MPIVAKPIDLSLFDIQHSRRFWASVDSDARPGGCWLWTGPTTSTGYGKFHLGGRYVPAHRLIFLLAGNDLPPELMVLHSCDNPRCVYPRHLRAGTHADNVADMVERRRQYQKRQPAAIGTRSCFITGCDHPECKVANRAYQREWAARSRNKGPSRARRIFP